MEGLTDHADSLGNAGRYGHGDLQWMTAGKGIVHGEMFPLINMDKPNPLRLFQIWLNLPRASKMSPPSFVMHWHERIPTVTGADDLTTITVWAGTLEGISGLPPPPNSYATRPESEVAVWLLNMQRGASYELPAAEGGDAVNRAVYFVEGDSVSIAGQAFDGQTRVDVSAAVPTTVTNTGAAAATVLLLQGRPIGEPVVQHGPFVMSSQAEIEQAFADYRATRFGGWPWPEDAVIFPADKGRFALVDGVESFPPAAVGERVAGKDEL